VEVDVFGAGGQAQVRLPQEPRQGATPALGPLGVDEQAQPLLEAQAAGRRAFLLGAYSARSRTDSAGKPNTFRAP